MNKQIEEMALDIYSASHLPLELCGALATDLVEEGYHKQEWISVDERLPDQDGKYYLAYTRKGFTVLSFYYALEGSFGFEHWDVTHWMPLPEAPKGGVGGMKWKEFLEIEDCDLCPIKEAKKKKGGYI